MKAVVSGEERREVSMKIMASDWLLELNLTFLYLEK
jgi:hypothetical protein